MELVQAKVLDSTHLELAKPIATGCGEMVLVVLAESQQMDSDRRQWIEHSSQLLQNAYSNIEPEYTPSMVRESNPCYRA